MFCLRLISNYEIVTDVLTRAFREPENFIMRKLCTRGELHETTFTDIYSMYLRLHGILQLNAFINRTVRVKFDLWLMNLAYMCTSEDSSLWDSKAKKSLCVSFHDNTTKS